MAIGPVIIAASAFALISYLVGNMVFANYLQIHAVPGAGELTVYCGALVGAGLGFLWFNAPPAMVFMGDTGSLSLGGGLGSIAVVTKHELVLAVVGGLFVLETAPLAVCRVPPGNVIRDVGCKAHRDAATGRQVERVSVTAPGEAKRAAVDDQIVVRLHLPERQ